MPKHRYHLSPKSANAKTGPIPVTTTSSDSCPPTCPLAGNGCYAEGSHLGMHWKAVSSGERGFGLDALCAELAQLPDATLWRHNQAGDLPTSDGRKLDRRALRQLTRANRGKRGFTYTHHTPRLKANREAIQEANQQGFTVNLSANNLAEADRYKALGIAPVVTVLPKGTRENLRTPAGRLVVVCPAETRDAVTCKSCKLCQWAGRDVIIGFPAHGFRAKAATLVSIGGAQ